jgi:co-chaperonin GroES (HSP10)
MTEPATAPHTTPPEGFPLVADPALFHRYTGETIHPNIAEFTPFGRRLVVMREAAVTMHGGVIHIPESAREVPARGWVIAVGNSIGSTWEPGAPTLGTVPVLPIRLIGCKILFGMYAGQALLTGDKGEDAYQSQYLVLDEGSIWGMVGTPPPEPLVELPTFTMPGK